MPSTSQVHLAVDLGASSGRVVAGLFDGERLSLEEVYRFDNGGIPAAGGMYWPLMNQWQHVLRGLKAAAKIYGKHVASVGVDTWGVDFALLGRHDELLGAPHHYRDRRTAGILDKLTKSFPRRDFQATGLRFMGSARSTGHEAGRLAAARHRRIDAHDPGPLSWLLTGVKSNEFTNATTTQMLNPRPVGTDCRSLWAGKNRHLRTRHALGPIQSSVAPKRT
jgi:rhamnulokinase